MSGGDGNLSQYLGVVDYARDVPTSSGSVGVGGGVGAGGGLLDVDEISDGDLLSANIDNMHVILSDLRTPPRPCAVAPPSCLPPAAARYTTTPPPRLRECYRLLLANHRRIQTHTHTHV